MNTTKPMSLADKLAALKAGQTVEIPKVTPDAPEQTNSQFQAANANGTYLRAAAAGIITLEPDQKELAAQVPQVSGSNADFAAKLGKGIDQIEGFDAAKFFLKLEELSLAIHANAPGVPTYLEQINQQLNQYPELVTKLSPEKINIVVTGALKITGISMADVVSKKKGKLSANEVMDLGF